MMLTHPFVLFPRLILHFTCLLIIYVVNAKSMDKLFCAYSL
uniref:Uncharacterized protein n=1 Tax=Rhizophora mucronata TaxID=61149 RepID=A0A2P2QLW1_RHIMU